MPNSLTSTGLTIATQQELYTNLSTALQQIYGSGINLSSDTPDGQWLNILIQAMLDTETLVQEVYSSFDPDNAVGTTLDQRCAINGVIRQAGTYTITNVTLVINQTINLYGLDQSTQPVYTVADSAGNQYQLITTQLGVSAGTSVFAFQASTPGVIIPIVNTITIPVTIVLGVTSINNPSAYTTLGIAEESDAALKIRRNISVSLPSQGYLQGLLAALEEINGITNAFVYENTGSVTDGDGVPGHSIWAIIAGTPNVALSLAWSATTTYSYGQIASSGGVNYISWQNNNLNNAVTDTEFWGVYNPVAQAIYLKRNAGCGMYGSTTYLVTQIDGTTFPIYYDTVSAETIFIKFTASSINGTNVPNISGILSQLPTLYTPGVYQEVNINQLATYVQQIDSNTLVTSAGFSTTVGGSYTNTLFPSTKNKQFVLSSADIIITPMILSAPNAIAVIVSGLVTNTTVSVAPSTQIQFTALGGYGTYTYSISVNNSGGSINSSSGLYTSGSTGSVQDTVLVTDSLSNTTTCIVSVT